MNKIHPFLYPNIQDLMSRGSDSWKPGLGPRGNPFQFLADQMMGQAWNAFLKTVPNPSQTGTSAQALTKQDAAPEIDPAREVAQIRIRDIMGDYDPEDGDADEKAQKIAGDPELCKYLTKEQRAELVKGLFDGSTGEDEEDAAMQILRSANKEDLKWVTNNVGWDELDDELDSHDIDELSRLLAQPEPVADTPSGAVFDEFGITPADLEPETGLEMAELKRKVQETLAGMSEEQIAKLADDLLANKKELLKEIADLERRGLDSKADKLRAILGEVAKHVSGDAKSQLDQFSWQIHYTSRISEELKGGDFAELLKFLPDLADPSLSKEQRVALYETLDNFKPELRAMEEVIREFGTVDQKASLNRFMNTYNAFMGEFDADLPAETVLEAILNRLGKTADNLEDSLQELKATVGIVVDEIQETLTLSHILDTASDDRAREIAQSLYSKGLLAYLPADFKVKLINLMLDGFTGDAEETAINHILEATKAANPDEFYQIIAAVGYDELSSNLHGEEWDDFLKLLAA